MLSRSVGGRPTGRFAARYHDLMTSAAGEETGRAKRVVLLGASNVTRAFPYLVDVAAQLCGSRLEILGALGHGRSYGLRWPFLWRELPGIVHSGLWQALEQSPAGETAALITDVGNDLLYDVPPLEIAAWVETCIERLQRAGAQIVLTALPLCSVMEVSRKRFLLLRSVLFPGCKLPYEAVLDRACDLDQRLRRLAQARAIALIEPRREWYRFDPIHVRRGSWATAWPEILATWLNGASPCPAALRRRWTKMRLRFLAPELRWVLGRERRRAQPAARLPDGTTISLY
jgi:hypothetical protein